MPAATVHGESDSLCTLKNDKILISTGRIYGRGRMYGTQDDYNCDTVQCFMGNGGLLFFSTIEEPPFDPAISYGHKISNIIADGTNYLYVLGMRADSGGDNIVKLNIIDLAADYWQQVWTSRVGAANQDVTLEDMCFDRSGDIIVVGYYEDPGQGSEKYIWKVDHITGAVIWSSGSPLGKCHRVDVDSDNNIYVTCEREAQYGRGLSRGVLQKYDTNGNFLWGWDSGNDEHNGRAVAVSPADEIFFSTRIAVTDQDSRRWIIYVFDKNGNLNRKLESGYEPDFVYEFVSFMKFDDEGNLYYIVIYDIPYQNTVYICKSDTDFKNKWTKTLTASRWPKDKIAIRFTPSKRFFLTTESSTLSANEFEEQSIRDDADGSVIWESDTMVSGFYRVLTAASLYQELQTPSFHTPKVWLNQYMTPYPSRARVPVRDSGCFIQPGSPFWKGNNPNYNPPASISAGDIFFHCGTSITDPGLFRARNNWTDWDANHILLEAYMKRLCRCFPKPFQCWPGKEGAWYPTDDYLDYKPYFVNALVCYEGKYYRCIKYDGFLEDPPDPEYWAEVDPPDPAWNSFNGFGGIGELDSAASPQTYTLTVKDVKDTAGNIHELNGIFYLTKDLGRDKWSRWYFIKHRPGGKNIRIEFVMFGGIEAPYPYTYSNPESWIKVEIGWLPEIPAYNLTTNYKAGDCVIYHSVDNIQRCYTCIQDHSGHAPTDTDYWTEQSEPWDTWSAAFNYSVDDYCLHRGEWYKCVTSERVQLSSTGYVDCVPSDIGKMVEVTDDNFETGDYWDEGKLLAYDNTARQWWIETDGNVYNDYKLRIKAGSGYGTASGNSTTAGGAHFDVEPPNGIYWRHLDSGDEDYPDDYKTVFQSNDCEDNYGCMYDWRDAENQNLPHLIGEAGAGSVYPGAIYQWSSRRQYAAADIVVWSGRFWRAVSGNTDSEPPSGNWELLGHPES